MVGVLCAAADDDVLECEVGGACVFSQRDDCDGAATSRTRVRCERAAFDGEASSAVDGAARAVRMVVVKHAVRYPAASCPPSNMMAPPPAL